MSQILRHYLTKEGRVGKLFYSLMRIKEPCVRKFEGLTRSKILGILQTDKGVAERMNFVALIVQLL